MGPHSRPKHATPPKALGRSSRISTEPQQSKSAAELEPTSASPSVPHRSAFTEIARVRLPGPPISRHRHARHVDVPEPWRQSCRSAVKCPVSNCARWWRYSPLSDADAQYSGYVEILQGSVVCRQGMLGQSSGPLLSYDAWVTDPRNVTVGGQQKSTYSYRLDGQYSIQPQTSGTFTCYSRFSVDGTTLGTLQQSMFINTCGDYRGELIKEYHDRQVNWTPECWQFATIGRYNRMLWIG